MHEQVTDQLPVMDDTELVQQIYRRFDESSRLTKSNSTRSVG